MKREQYPIRTGNFAGLAMATSMALLMLHPQLTTSCAQGSLTPPGPPGPTMKSLDQLDAKLERRTPVDAAHTPGDNFNLFIISQPGSYYFTTNILCANGKDGIEIVTNNITIDLNGFTLLGNVNAHFGYGIYIPNSGGLLTNVVIRNGIISSWAGNGYTAVASFGQYVTLERLILSLNDYGVFCTGSTVIRNCTVSGNNNDGIHAAASDCLIVGNTCSGNNVVNSSGYAGIYVVGANNRIEDNHLSGNGAAGNGIAVINGFSYTNNIVIRNSVAGGGANNYAFGNAQIVGPLITNSASGVITNSNPWANFSF